MSFWDTLPGLIASWAAAVAGLLYLARKSWNAAVRSRRFFGRAARAIDRVLELGDTESWPNGSETLPQSLHEIYDRQGETHELLRTHIEEEKAQYSRHLEMWHRRDT